MNDSLLRNYAKIKDAYNEFRISLLKKGKLPLRETPVGFWGPSICDEIFLLMQQIQAERFSHFLDIGSGDGRVVLISSLFTKSTGIERDFELYKKSVEIAKKLGRKATFLYDDFYNHDLGRYDAIFCYPDKPLYHGLLQKLSQELDGLLIIYGLQQYPISLNKEHEYRIHGTVITTYTR
jgi:protein-L-isoaspartate O-methyltransferase